MDECSWFLTFIYKTFLTKFEDDRAQDKGKHHGVVDKPCVLRTVSTFIVLKTGPIHLVLVGLTADSPSDKKLVVLENLITQLQTCL